MAYTINDVYIGDDISPGSFAMTIVGTIISVFIGAAGLSLLIAGLIWFFVRGSSNKKARQAQVVAGRAGASSHDSLESALWGGDPRI